MPRRASQMSLTRPTGRIISFVFIIRWWKCRLTKPQLRSRATSLWSNTRSRNGTNYRWSLAISRGTWPRRRSSRARLLQSPSLLRSPPDESVRPASRDGLQLNTEIRSSRSILLLRHLSYHSLTRFPLSARSLNVSYASGTHGCRRKIGDACFPACHIWWPMLSVYT